MEETNYNITTFRLACENARNSGDTKYCKELIDTHHDEYSPDMNDNAFLSACEFGLVDVANYLLDKFEIKFYKYYGGAFIIASRKGFLGIIKILMDLNHKYYQKIYNTYDETIFGHEYSHVECVLCQTCKNCGVTENACTQNLGIDIANHYGIVQFIFDKYNTGIDSNTRERCLRDSCSNNNCDIIYYLLMNNEFSLKVIKNNFITICENGNLELAKLFIKKYPQTDSKHIWKIYKNDFHDTKIREWFENGCRVKLIKACR